MVFQECISLFVSENFGFSYKSHTLILVSNRRYVESKHSGKLGVLVFLEILERAEKFGLETGFLDLSLALKITANVKG